jgi:hypothetical protein
MMISREMGEFSLGLTFIFDDAIEIHYLMEEPETSLACSSIGLLDLKAPCYFSAHLYRVPS